MNQLNFKHLYYFLVVAREGSIKSAAEKIHVSQPTISDQLKLLEEYFKAPLFERRNRSLVLNANGKLALQYAQKIFDLGNELTYTIRHDAPKTSINLGITHFMSQYFNYDTLLPLLKQRQMEVRIREATRLELLAQLEEDQVDIMFTDSRDSLSSSVHAFRVGMNRTFAVGHPKFHKLKEGFPGSLNGVPFFNYTIQSSIRFEIELFLAKHGITPHQVGEADDVDLLQLICERGLAFAIVPEAAKKRFVRSNAVIVLGELEELQTSVWALVKKGNRGLIDLLRKQAK